MITDLKIYYLQTKTSYSYYFDRHFFGESRLFRLLSDNVQFGMNHQDANSTLIDYCSRQIQSIKMFIVETTSNIQHNMILEQTR